MKNFSMLQKKISPKNRDIIIDKFAIADSLLTPEEQDVKNPILVLRKTFSIPQNEAEIFKKIRSKALDYRVVLSDSEIVRLGLVLLTQLQDNEFQEKILNLNKLQTGRPKLHK